ncbi:MAG: HAD family hydrolase [Lachnospiraceae bacterium]|nr:HAD family hydrolase [Lachnospiraceae bacterium]
MERIGKALQRREKPINDKTLYITDLDGTLLHNDETVSEQTIQILNRLVKRGMKFSYATARSRVTAGHITRGLCQHFPVVLYNGAFIMDSTSSELVCSHFFNDKENDRIQSKLKELAVSPIVYSFIDEKEQFSFVTEAVTDGMKKFLDTRKSDIRRREVDSEDRLYLGYIFYYTCIDTEEKLAALYEELKSEFQCVLSKDIYSEEWWLEIMPKDATKANAVQEVKKICGCEKVVCFGDGINDRTMFEICDEAYAVGNACEDLKEIATGVIGTNEEDAVAEFLRRRFDEN